MGTTRFCRSQDNRVLSPSTTIINGNAGTRYPSAPALVEDSQYPTSNLKIADRYTPWATPHGSSPSSMLLHLDLGSNVSVSLIALFGIRWLGSSSFPNSCTVGYRLGTTSPPAYGYAATGFTSIASPVFTGSRDIGVIIAPTAARYWEFNFSLLDADGWSVGAIYLGQVTNDLGFLYSAGMEEAVVHQVIHGRTGAGHPHVTTVGDVRRLVTMPFQDVDDTAKNKIDNVFGQSSSRDPAIWIDRSDVVRQVILKDDNLRWSHTWASPNVWSTDLELEVLG